VAAAGWPEVHVGLIGGSRCSINGQCSTVNFDRAETGLRRAGLGLDTVRVGSGRPGHVSSGGCVHVAAQVQKWPLAAWAWLTVNRAVGSCEPQTRFVVD
jgi:hypothetical protein